MIETAPTERPFAAGPVAPTTIEALEAMMLRLVSERGPGRTICPSEAARAVAGNGTEAWAPLMQPARKIAVRLMKQGKLVITRKGRAVDPDDFRGVYRLGLPQDG
jgi:hypothetical protein